MFALARGAGGAAASITLLACLALITLLTRLVLLLLSSSSSCSCSSSCGIFCPVATVASACRPCICLCRLCRQRGGAAEQERAMLWSSILYIPYPATCTLASLVEKEHISAAQRAGATPPPATNAHQPVRPPHNPNPTPASPRAARIPQVRRKNKN